MTTPKILLSLLLSFLVSASAWGGVDFSGDDDMIAMPDITVEETPLSASARINYSSLANTPTIIAKYNGSTRAFLWRVETDGKISLYTHNGSTQLQSKTQNAVISVNVEYHVGFRFDGSAGNGKIDFFVDGVQVATDAVVNASASIVNTAVKLTIGRWEQSGINVVPGKVNEVAFWTGVEISDSEFYNLNSKVKRMPLQIAPSYLKIYLPLDDYSGGSALVTTANGYKDISGNGNHGTGTDADGDSLNIAESVLSYP